ncbi:MAG: RNA chaperone Hfq [Bacillota bacterium]
MKTQLILQDIILNHSRRERKPVTAILCGGESITGIVRGFDQQVVILDTKQNQLMLYKSNILYVISSDFILSGETRLE